MAKSSNLVVVLDACILYPAPLRDYLLNLATQKIYQPKWSKEINEKWVRSLLTNRPDFQRERLVKTVESMDNAFPDANVEKDISTINLLILPDLADRHVLATAIKSKAESIITANVKDFPSEYVNQFEVSIQNT